MNLIKEKWSEILEHVRKEHELSDISFETWLLPLTVYSTDNHVVKIIVPMGEQMITYLNSKFKTPIFVAIAEFTGEKYEVEFITEKEAMEQKITEVPASSAAAPAERPVNSPDFEKSNINPKFTFDTFVVGSNNKFAHAASLAVAETPGKVYNPLFLHGGVGLGKTHLMHAIANHILKENPNMKVLYVTSEYFTNELIETLRMGDPSGMTRFREKYRNIDVLLIDDVQFIIGKESTQEEFFHTFNTLREAGKQIVLTSDRPPKEITQLEDRLRTRFEQGLMVDVAPPDFETRFAIVQNKAAMLGVKLPNEVTDYIAENITSNVRQIEGTLNKILAYRDLLDDQVNEETVSRAIRDMLKKSNDFAPSPKTIISYICSYCSVDEETLRGQSRGREVVAARQIAIYLIRRMSGMSLDDIGREFGDRDHSTILHSLKKVEQQMRTDPAFAEKVKEITTNINSKQ